MAHGEEEVGMIPPPVELKLSSSQKWPLEMIVGHQMFALKWPWVAGHRKGKEKMKPNDWWGEPQTEVGLPSPQRKENTKKKGVFFWTSLVADGR